MYGGRRMCSLRTFSLVTGHFGFMLKKKKIRSRKSHDIVVKPSLQAKCFPGLMKMQSQRLKYLRFEERVFEQLRFRDGLVWTVSLTVEFLRCSVDWACWE